MPFPSLLSALGVENPDNVIDDEFLQDETVDSAANDVETILGITDVTQGDDTIPVREIGSDPSQAQYNALESVQLADPFTLAVKDSSRAGTESTDYAVTAFYGEFNEAPSDRLYGPRFPLSFDKNGIATVTIGSRGTDADVTTRIAPGDLSDDASLINNIEVPEGAEAMAVETTGGVMTAGVAEASPETGGVGIASTDTVEENRPGFTEVETVGER